MGDALAQHPLEVRGVMGLEHGRLARQMEVPQAGDPEPQGPGAQQAGVAERFGALLAEPVPTTPQQFESFMASERAKYKDVVKLSGAKVD